MISKWYLKYKIIIDFVVDLIYHEIKYKQCGIVVYFDWLTILTFQLFYCGTEAENSL